MKKILFLIFFLSIFAGSTPSFALVMGNDFYKLCEPIQKKNLDYEIIQEVCAYYVMGVTDALQLTIAHLQENGIKNCKFIPSDVNSTQLLDIFIKYLKDKPQNRNNAAAALIEIAVSEAFTLCTKPYQTPSFLGKK
ncbi:MAG: hypothetical protein IPP67_06785 [Rhodospirillaceae bacterium]|nr:hypothetical protein [Rhodospirillaceae bacterium]